MICILRSPVQPQFGGLSLPVDQPPVELLAQAAQVIDHVKGPLLYTRVDGVYVAGTFRLMELELIEPRWFLASTVHTPQRYANAMRQLL